MDSAMKARRIARKKAAMVATMHIIPRDGPDFLSGTSAISRIWNIGSWPETLSFTSSYCWVSILNTSVWTARSRWRRAYSKAMVGSSCWLGMTREPEPTPVSISLILARMPSRSFLSWVMTGSLMVEIFW